jgi:hypothetical protein
MTETAAFSPGGAVTFIIDASNRLVPLGGENSMEASDGALISCLNATVGRFGIAQSREPTALGPMIILIIILVLLVVGFIYLARREKGGFNCPHCLCIDCSDGSC